MRMLAHYRVQNGDSGSAPGFIGICQPLLLREGGFHGAPGFFARPPHHARPARLRHDTHASSKRGLVRAPLASQHGDPACARRQRPLSHVKPGAASHSASDAAGATGRLERCRPRDLSEARRPRRTRRPDRRRLKAASLPELTGARTAHLQATPPCRAEDQHRSGPVRNGGCRAGGLARPSAARPPRSRLPTLGMRRVRPVHPGRLSSPASLPGPMRRRHSVMAHLNPSVDAHRVALAEHRGVCCRTRTITEHSTDK
jgi:hypothetical protein